MLEGVPDGSSLEAEAGPPPSTAAGLLRRSGGHPAAAAAAPPDGSDISSWSAADWLAPPSGAEPLTVPSAVGLTSPVWAQGCCSVSCGESWSPPWLRWRAVIRVLWVIKKHLQQPQFRYGQNFMWPFLWTMMPWCRHLVHVGFRVGWQDLDEEDIKAELRTNFKKTSDQQRVFSHVCDCVTRSDLCSV